MIPTNHTRSILRARGGCRLAFARLWATHEAKVRHFVQRRVPAGLADDVVQDTALAALHGIGTLRAEGDFVAWVLAIANHRAASACRRWLRERARLAADDGLATAVAGDAEERQRSDRREVLGWLRRLPRCYRLPLWLRYVNDCSAVEIADRLGTTQGTVRVALHRALRHLRQLRDVLPKTGA
jgi:RNA polymerase sigma-70 factor (ECF subfamily)